MKQGTEVHLQQQRFQELALVRLLVFGEKGGTLAAVRRDLQSCTGLGEQDAQQALELAMQSLRDAKHAEELGKGRLRATPEGTRRALRFLGVSELAPPLTWSKVRDTLLVARALEIPAPRSPKARRSIATLGGLRAAILRKHNELPLDEYPTLNEARDALAWKGLGRETGVAFSVTNVLTWLLARQLDEPEGTDARKPSEALAHLALECVGATSAKPAELRSATIRKWLNASSAAAEAVSEPPAPGSASRPTSALSLEAFSERVGQAARECDSGRFGDDKIFISHVWRVLEGQLGVDSLDGFKARLLEANREGHLPLSRADMVQAMNPDDVRESETSHLNACFHFIRIR